MDYAGRRRRLREQLARHRADLIAVSPGANMRYLLGYSSHPDERPCYLLLTERGEGMLMPELNATEAQHHVDLPMEVYDDADSALPPLKRLADHLGFASARQILVDETMRADFALLLHEAVPGSTLGTTTSILGEMRMRKDAEEIQALRSNARQADAAMQVAFDALRPGMTEADIAEVVASTFANEGAEKLNFAIIGSGPNGAFPHHATSRRRVEEGDAIVMDIGAMSGGYNSDLTRMAFIGSPDDTYRAIHGIVNQAVEAALAVIRPGVALHQVDDAARNVIREAGYGDFFTHRTGHGIGLNGHEPPYVTASSAVPIEPGMTFSVEPGIYLPGRFGVRLEEIVVVTDGGVDVFSRLSREVFVMKPI